MNKITFLALTSLIASALSGQVMATESIRDKMVSMQAKELHDRDAIVDNFDELSTRQDISTLNSGKNSLGLKANALGVEIVEGGIYFVTASALNVRDAERNVVGQLVRNNQVKVLSLNTVLGGAYVAIELVSENSSVDQSSVVFVSQDYLSLKETEYVAPKDSSKYYIVQNIATERVRIYEKNCNEQGLCNNKMVFETEVAVGEDSKGTRSILGSLKITKWNKFYQDGAKNYPRWYSPELGLPPEAGSSALTWTNRKYLRKGQKSGMRGAFGWFAAHVGPNAHYQWMHGTIGWGEDKADYIDRTKGFWANLVTDPRSHGCTRFNNEAIAYVRSLLPVGTPVIKIYAEERLHDSSLSRYRGPVETFEYILTSLMSNGDAGIADKNYVLENVAPEKYLDAGVFKIDKTPSLVEFDESGSKTKSGNVYGLDRDDMVGVFYVDIGMAKNYRHPRGLTVGGYKGILFPSYVSYTNLDTSL